MHLSSAIFLFKVTNNIVKLSTIFDRLSSTEIFRADAIRTFSISGILFLPHKSEVHGSLFRIDCAAPVTVLLIKEPFHAESRAGSKWHKISFRSFRTHDSPKRTQRIKPTQKNLWILRFFYMQYPKSFCFFVCIMPLK